MTCKEARVMQYVVKVFPILMMCLTFTFSATSQTPGSVDLTFNPTDIGYGYSAGANQIIRTVSVQNDGKVLVGGEFTSLNGSSINRIARLNTDQSVDSSLAVGSGANNSVWSSAIQPDGKILIGGYFTSYNGEPVNRIARLNVDGSLDSSFQVGTGFNNNVYSIAVQPDGKILVAGVFSSYNGAPLNSIARLNSNGTLDTTFDTGTGPDQYVQSVSVQTDGKLIIGGSFETVDGVAAGHIARLNANGSLDQTFSVGSGTDDVVWATEVQQDGKIIIGGDFTTIDGAARNRLARLNSDGSIDQSFSIGSGANGFIYSTCIQSDGKIIIGGQFTVFSGFQANRVIRLNTDGSTDPTFQSGEGFDNDVYSVALTATGEIVAVGDFQSYDNRLLNRVVRIETSGAFDDGFTVGTGADYPLFALAIQPDGKILIGGNFLHYNGVPRAGFARLNVDGTLDETFDVVDGIDHSAYTIAVQANGKIVTGKEFLRRYEPSGDLDTTFNQNGHFGFMDRVLIQNDQKILVSGYNSGNGNGGILAARKGIVRINVDGSIDNTFDSGTGINQNNYIANMALQSDGKIIIVGSFTEYDGTQRNRIARINSDGALDNSFNPGTGPDDFVETVAIQNDGKIVIAGRFNYFNGYESRSIARLFSDGTLDQSFDSGSGLGTSAHLINDLTIQPDGKIIISGDFYHYNNNYSVHLARINSDGSFDADFDVGSGAYGGLINCLALQDDGKVVIGGGFGSFNGIKRNRVTRLNGLDSPNMIQNPVSDKTDLIVYPNPTGGNFSIVGASNTNMSRIRIYNPMGVLVSENQTVSREMINITLPDVSGLYCIEVLLEDGTISRQKVVKK
ncbi:MAG: T9SS type A sorting domain-containing protein [Flavobacteriales bacterium]|nr:T9SS type A sorting domain-containing protein [Flavobacteriales bacterium]